MSSINLKPKYFFGKEAIFEAKEDIKNKAYKKALILYGGGSVKSNGSYNDLIKLLTDIKLEYVEFSGIEPNPKNTTVDKCISFAKENKVDVIFAIGGGSVVDASKVIGVLTTNDTYKNCWEYCLDQSKITKPSIDIVAIITLAGTASENNAGSVITNIETNEKLGVFTPSAIPVISIENPIYTFSVNKWQTASGIFDCFSHLMEQYFGKETFEWTKNYIFGNMKTLVKFAKKAIDNPNDYEARSNVLWTTSMALNGFAGFDSDGDWTVHTIEHAFSGLWDVTHGAGLAFVTPTYLKIKSQKEPWFKEKVVEFGKNIFNSNTFEETILSLKNFIKSIYLPTKWTEFNEIKTITSDDIRSLVEHSLKFNYSPSDKNLIEEVINELSKLN